MECLTCKNLELALESRRSEYVEARSSAYYQVTTEFAAHKSTNWYAFPPQNEAVCSSRQPGSRKG